MTRPSPPRESGAATRSPAEARPSSSKTHLHAGTSSTSRRPRDPAMPMRAARSDTSGRHSRMLSPRPASFGPRSRRARGMTWWCMPSRLSRRPLSNRSMAQATRVASTHAPPRALGRPRASPRTGKTALLHRLDGRRPQSPVRPPTTTAIVSRVALPVPEAQLRTHEVISTSCTQLATRPRWVTLATPSMLESRLATETVALSADSGRSVSDPTSGGSATPTTSRVHA
jgi:hypothetical protein